MGLGLLRRRLLLALCSGVAGLLMSACGGGGGGGGGFLPVGGDDPGPGQDPSSGFTASQRSEATARIAEKFEQLAGSDAGGDAAWSALRDWVLTQPEYTAAGVGDRLLWAQFKDGRYFVYTDNWRPLPPDAAGTRQAAAKKTAAPPALAAAKELPGTADALILGFTGEEFDAGTATMSRMSQALTDLGWKVAGDRALTVDALKNRGELGFLYLTSHSGLFGPTGSEQFSVMTDTEVSVLNEFEYREDLRDGSLIYHRDRTNWQRFGLGKSPRYAVTAAFVDKYLRFSPNSLVVMLSCHSGADKANGFHAALSRQKAGTIIGWDGNSNGNAFKAVDLLVDRLSGANAVDPVTPRNRPFNLDDVWTYLGKKGQLATAPVEIGTAVAVRRFGDGFTMFNPIIAELQATGPNKLILHGDFGSEAGTVTVGGQMLAPKWAADGKTVEVDLGTDAHGEVFVTARNRRSNVRVLASWRGQVTYEHEEEAVSNCGGAKFHNTAVIKLHLRADAHGIRSEVDETPKNSWRLVVPATDTRATWTADGSCSTGGQLHTSWSGSGAFTFDANIDPLSPYPPTGEMGNLLQARIDTVEQRFQLAGVFGQKETYTEVSLGTPSQQPLQFDMQLAGFVNDGPDYSKLLPFGTFLLFDGGQNVQGDQHKLTDPVLLHSLRVQWGGMSVSPAYDDSVAR